MTEETLFHEALAKANSQERSAFLDAACVGQPELRAAVDALLAAYERPANLLDHPAVARPATTEETPVTERPGTVIGPYKIIRQLGQGGFGTVYLAEQEKPVRRLVALKIIKPGMDTAQVIARFESERQALAMMDHPNIAKVLDAGATESGRPFFVMELVKGITITEFCDRNQVSLEIRLKLFIDVCNAIQHAHHKGIIHRDVKPSNVMVTQHDGVPVVKVIDFGVAKATMQKLTERTLFTVCGQMIGTPAYMSPEQAEMSGLDIDTRSDVYSLGVLLYELLTGATPLESERLREAGYAEMQRLIREEEPPRPSTRLSSLGDSATVLAFNRGLDPKRLVQLLAGDLDWVVMKALEKDRKRRYDTATGLARDIERYLHDEPVEACPPSRSYRLRKFALRYKKTMAIVTAFGLLLMAATVSSVCLASWALRERKYAEEQQQVAETNETEAKERADEIRAVLEFVENQIFAAARPLGQEGGLGREVSIREAIASALEYVEDSFREQPLIEARLRETIGTSFTYLGDGQAAETQFERAREIRTATLGPDHPDTLCAMNGLASAYYVQSRYREAAELHKRTLDLRKTKLGTDHPDTLRSMGNFANALSVLGGHQDEAQNLHEETFELQAAVLGRDHPDTIKTMTNLASAYRAAGRHESALQLSEEAFQRRKAKYGSEHPSTLHSSRTLARTYAAVGRHADALHLREETLRLRKEKLGLEHRDTLISMADLASSYHAVGRHEDALDLQEKTLPLMKAKFGAAGYESLFLMNDLAKSYAALGRHDEASRVREEMEAMRQAIKSEKARTKTHRATDRQD